MRSLIRPLVVAASVLVACGGISGCSGEPESNSGKMDTGNMTGPMAKPDSGKMPGAMDKMEPGKMNPPMDKMEPGKKDGAMDKMEKGKM